MSQRVRIQLINSQSADQLPSDRQLSNQLMSALQQVNQFGSTCMFNHTRDEEFGNKIAYQWAFPNTHKTL